MRILVGRSAPAGVEELKYIAATTPTGAQRFLYAVGAAGVHRLISGSRATSTPTFETVITTGLNPDLKVTTPDANRTGQWSAVDGAATSTGSRIVLSSAFMPEPSSAFTGRRTAYVDVTETNGAVPANDFSGHGRDVRSCLGRRRRLCFEFYVVDP